MTSRKYTLLAVLGCLFASVAFAQSTTYGTRAIYGVGHDVTDSTHISKKKLPQHSEFLAGTYDYPAKPRDMWEVGIKAGLFTLASDVRPMASYGGAIHIRKALGHTLSLRLEGMYGRARGQNWKESKGYVSHSSSPWFQRTQNTNQFGQGVYYNYRTIVQDLSLQLLANVHNIRFYKQQTGLTLYVLGGAGLTTWCPQSDIMNGTTPYDYRGIVGKEYSKRKDVLKALRDLQVKYIPWILQTLP